MGAITYLDSQGTTRFLESEDILKPALFIFLQNIRINPPYKVEFTLQIQGIRCARAFQDLCLQNYSRLATYLTKHGNLILDFILPPSGRMIMQLSSTSMHL